MQDYKKINCRYKEAVASLCLQFINFKSDFKSEFKHMKQRFYNITRFFLNNISN